MSSTDILRFVCKREGCVQLQLLLVGPFTVKAIFMLGMFVIYGLYSNDIAAASCLPQKIWPFGRQGWLCDGSAQFSSLNP